MKKLFFIYIMSLFGINKSAAQDSCSNALNIAYLTNPCSGLVTVADTTQEIGLPSCIGTGVFNRESWYSFTVTGSPQPMSITGTNTTASANLLIEVFSGGCSNLTPIACVNNINANSTQFEQSPLGILDTGTYFFRMVNIGTNVDMVLSNICVFNSLVNDECPGITLTPTAICTPTTGTIGGSTNSFVMPSCTGTGSATDDVWYRFTSNSIPGQSYTVTVAGSAGMDVVFQIYQTSCAFTSINCTNNNNIPGGTETATLNFLSPSTQYWIRVYDAGTVVPATTDFTICITAPLQDDCPGIQITPWGSWSSPSGCMGSTTASTQDATASPFVSCSGIADDDVWFNFIAEGLTQIIYVTGSGTFDPVIQAYENSCGGTDLGCSNTNGAGTDESLYLTGLTVGNTYWIRVYDAGTGNGNPNPTNTTFTICVSTPPSNDFCTEAFLLYANTNCMPIQGSTAGATQSSPGICPSAAASNDDVWYRWTACLSTQTITVTGTSAAFDPVFEVFADSCGVTSIGCYNSSANASEINSLNGLTIGATYWMRVYDAGVGIAASNEFSICIESCGTVGINEPKNTLEEVIVYPNPFTTETSITFGEQQTNTTVKISDLMGNEIRTINFTGLILRIEKAEMKSGIYFVHTTDNQKRVKIKKIIIL